MPDLSSLAVYVTACLILAVTPGPGIFYVAARSLAGGREEGIASSLGTGFGGMAHVLAGSLGVSALVLASAELFTLLKFAGAAYLIWIGARTILTVRRESAAILQESAASPPVGVARAFREGILVEALNPKTAVFFLAFIPQFVDPSSHVALQFIVLGFISVLFNTLADIAVALAAGSIRQGAAERPQLIRRLREGSGMGMVALGLGLMLAKRPAG